MAKKNFTGSIFYRSGGKKNFVAQIMVNGQRKSKSFLRKSEAIEWLLEMEEIRDVMGENGQKAFLKDFLSYWLETKKPSQVNSESLGEQDMEILLSRAKLKIKGERVWKATTFATNNSIFRNHILPYIDDKTLLTDVDPDWIYDFLARLSVNKVGDRTLQIVQSLLHASFQTALSERIIKYNPVQGIKIDYSPEERKALSLEEFKKLVEVTKGSWYQNIIIFALMGTLRKGEVLGLQWDDIDWAGNTVFVQRQLQRLPEEGKEKRQDYKEFGGDGTSLQMSTLKSKRAKRLILLGPNSMEILKQQQALLARQKVLCGEKWIENNLVFPNQLGNPLEESTLRGNFNKALEKAGLDSSFVFHDIRHSGITYLSLPEVGASVKVAGKRAGHSTSRMTLHYTHALEEYERIAALNFDKFVFEKTE